SRIIYFTGLMIKISMLDYRFEYRYVRPSLKADLMTSISCRSEPRVNIAIINWPQSREGTDPLYV
ncbi:TPA: hypothetical protein ACOEDH_003764, partial [Enterobacter roggenkampii]